MQRLVDEEWLDFDQGTPAEISSALRSVSLVNRLFGGDRLHARLLQAALAHIPPRETAPHILEVACGHADVLQAALLRLAVPAQVTLLDRSAQHLPSRDEWPRSLQPPNFLVGDAIEIPLPDQSVDIVACCLFLHHLEPPQVACFLTDASRVARVAVVINDLERTYLHHALAQLFSGMDRSRISRHDGPVSVRRAYTHRELTRMLANTGHAFRLERSYLYRLGAILWV